MIWLRLWRWVRGWVRFEAEGGSVGRMLSLAARARIPLWDTRREGCVLSARCRAADYRRLRPLFRRCGLRARIRERHGAVFLLRRYHARPGLLAGIAVYALLLLWLSGRIWAIDIRGLSAANETALREFLTEYGVAVGQKKADVNPQAIQLAAIQELPDISWLAVNLDGCVAEVELRETNTQESPPPEDTPSNLVAARDGRILSMSITRGEAVVQVGDAVAEGGLLASGITATERETLLRRSQGVVMAETTRRLTVRVPLNEVLLCPAGTPRESLTLCLFGQRLPLSDSDLSPVGCQVEESAHFLTLGGVSLPLGVELRRCTPLAEQPVSRTPEEAQAQALQRLNAEEAQTLADAQITSRTLSTVVEQDVLVLTADYQCVENIALEIPLQLDDAVP